ncbi:MAG: asparaginase [Gemmatimonadales bacterium]|nr:asparaginase [Gemmatimonadales bacterium]
MTDLCIEALRGDLVESVHRVSAAVVDADGRLTASAGDPSQVTFWRSAAKPFQALPLVDDGAADAFGFTPAELALACASHSSEPMHLAVADGMLHRIGATAGDLACGPHPPLSPALAEQVARAGTPLTPLWSNCSGKHAAMLALARHHGWPLPGYHRAGHPVQQRILHEVSRWTGVPAAAISTGIDGCAAVTFALPLQAMAAAWARLGTAPERGPGRLRAAMAAHPELVAGTRRLCTELMASTEGRVLAKVGAAGIYCAALPEARLGIALKVVDGDMAASEPALLAVLGAVVQRARLADRFDWTPLAGYAERAVLNTRGARVGTVRASGALRFHD